MLIQIGGMGVITVAAAITIDKKAEAREMVENEQERRIADSGEHILVCLSSAPSNAKIIMVYILGVLLTSIATSHQVYSLLSSIASVFIFYLPFLGFL